MGIEDLVECLVCIFLCLIYAGDRMCIFQFTAFNIYWLILQTIIEIYPFWKFRRDGNIYIFRQRKKILPILSAKARVEYKYLGNSYKSMNSFLRNF